MLKNVTFNGHSFDTPDKLRSTHFYLTQERCTRIFHGFAHVAVLISRACHQNGAHSGSLALIWDNVQDYFQEKWGGEKTIVQSTKYCRAQTVVPPVLTAALSLIALHLHEQQRRKTVFSYGWRAVTKLKKNGGQSPGKCIRYW